MISPLNAKLDRKWIEASQELEALRRELADAKASNATRTDELLAATRQLAAMTVERDELKKSVEYWASHAPTDAYVDALAAEQAYSQQLREELKHIASYNKNPAQAAFAALALPHDDTALKQWGAKLLRDKVLPQT